MLYNQILDLYFTPIFMKDLSDVGKKTSHMSKRKRSFSPRDIRPIWSVSFSSSKFSEPNQTDAAQIYSLLGQS